MQLIKQFVPVPVKHKVRQWLNMKPAGVVYQSKYTNIYHCCVQKTASRWLLMVFQHKKVYRYSGLKPYTYETSENVEDRPMNARIFNEPMPPQTICTPLYWGYDSLRHLPKPDAYRAFFVMRDPRDIVVSWYFSALHSHAPLPKVLEYRAQLEASDKAEGLHLSIDFIAETGLFEALESWLASKDDPNTMLVRYEDLTGPDNYSIFRDLFEFCDIQIPAEELKVLVQEHSFETLVGRERGQENIKSNFRKGVPGDWKNHLTDDHIAHLNRQTNDLTAKLGYAE